MARPSSIRSQNQGGDFDSHDDIPDSLRDQLYAEENQRLDKQKKPTDNSDNSTIGSPCPPVNINVLQAGSSQQSMPPPANDAIPAKPGYAESIMVHGLLDVAVEEYTEWQRSR
ncbi:hypothetical protein Asppvi_005708 [Aspergillus pseudoviridinutans]|uniref:Uncharacterized protein n=1 Tax=Aspergillus pseudoviridinutans TaxID=1517512 RepID=A0A9P3EUN0_9EURO|nr:uncharacterized protein Asppvi_005708 [Aspergillus pseudoviridinutans]GIJ86812.1 hypothetical protein Asppvi_005708 [Aspergillus pseudoviridinutans]